MKFFAAIVAIAVAAIVNAQPPPVFTDCAPLNADLHVDDFDICPYPLCINQLACATVKGTLSTPVTAGATLSIIGSFLNTVVYTDSADLCALLAPQGYICPLPTTMTSITACIWVKPTAPANLNVNLKVSAVNGGGSVLFCQAAVVVAQIC
ncbi:hypothetical protein BGZ76_000108 [Entomortierella beljakovae]|nr:hypothetical protein BGZ76_000108 [Entomortierella beljakovae]